MGRRVGLGVAYDRPLAMSYGNDLASNSARRASSTGSKRPGRSTRPISKRRAIWWSRCWHNQLQTLARSVRVDGDRVVVFNPLPWPRDGLVSVPWQGPLPPALQAVDGTAASAGQHRSRT